MKRIFLIIPILIILCVFAVNFIFAQEQGTAMGKHIEATVNYKAGKYDKVIENYEAILTGGLENGNVYYNLANSYFKKGDYGKARLNYEKAFKFIPADSDLNYNYNYILRVINEDSMPNTMFLIRFILNRIRYVTFGQIFYFALILLFVLSSGFLLIKYFNLSFSFLKRFLLIFVIMFFISSFLTVFKFVFNENKAIVISQTDAYFEPKAESTVHFNFKSGSKVQLISHSDNWVKVKRFDGKLGWIPEASVEKI